MDFWGIYVGPGLHWMIFVGPFPLRVFCDSLIPVGCELLPTSHLIAMLSQDLSFIFSWLPDQEFEDILPFIM